MSSPHLRGMGEFIPRSTGAAARTGSASGRNSPAMPSSPANRTTPAQLTSTFGRPIPNRAQAASGGSDDEEDDDDRAGSSSMVPTGSIRAGSIGGMPNYRPITPSRFSPRGAAPVMPPSSSSPPNGSGIVSAGSLRTTRVFPPSSRNPDVVGSGPDDVPLQIHASDTGRLPAADPNEPFVAPGDVVADDQEGDVVAAGGEAKPVRYADLPPVLKGYLLGQIACVIKFGVWWVGFTYLILALFGGSGYLVGATRICFNLALLFVSPLAGGIAEKANIKHLLNRTVFARGVVYCVAIPLAWVMLDSGLLWHTSQAMYDAFFVVFLLIIFVDGVGVSFSNVADIDSGGLNIVAAQYGVPIDDNVRNYFNSLHILFFDLSMVLFNPLLAYVGLFIGQHTVSNAGGISTEQVDEMTLLIAIGGVFLLSTILTLVAYNVYMPDLEEIAPAASTGAAGNPAQVLLGESVEEGQAGSLNAVSAPAEPEVEPLSWAAFKVLMVSVREGASLTWDNTRIRYRVLFFAVETSVEDAMIALIAAMVGSEVLASEGGELHYAWGNLWGAGLVAVGKVGGVGASVLMHRYFAVDEAAERANPGQAYRPLFWFAFLGGLCSLLLPVALHLRTHSIIPEVWTSVLLFASMFLFFLFSTLSKIGFSTLMQSMAGESEATGRIFGFVAAYVTATDAAVLMGMSALFSALELQTALWVATGFIALHGFVELVFGPGLVLKKKNEALDAGMDLAQPLM